jgi:hypothetical protein
MKASVDYPHTDAATMNPLQLETGIGTVTNKSFAGKNCAATFTGGPLSHNRVYCQFEEYRQR